MFGGRQTSFSRCAPIGRRVIAFIIAGGVVLFLAWTNEYFERFRHLSSRFIPEGIEAVLPKTVRFLIISNPVPKVWVSRGLFSDGTIYLTQGFLYQYSSKELETQLLRARSKLKEKITIANGVGLLLERTLKKTLPRETSRWSVLSVCWFFLIWPWLRLIQGMRKDDEYGSTA